MTDDLTGRVDRLEALVATLAAENTELKARLAAPPASEGATPSPPTDVAGSVGRRSLITKGLAAAGTAAAGAVVLGAEPAAAGNGDALLIGGNNFGTAATRLNVNAPGTDGGVQIIDSGGLPALGGLKPALVIGTSGAPLTSGMFVQATGTGIAVYVTSGNGITSSSNGIALSGSSSQNIGITGSGTIAGIRGYSGQSEGIGVDGAAALDPTGLFGTQGTGVRGTGGRYGVLGSGPVGVRGASTTGTGVEAEGKTYGLLAEGTGDGATGVDGFGQHIGVRGAAPAFAGDTNCGVLGEARIGVKGRATIANGIGVFAENTLGVAIQTIGRGGAHLDASQYHLRFGNTLQRLDPTGDTIAHTVGDMVETTAGDLWLCTIAGTPGTWRKVGGPATAGAFHVLPSPARVYDSRAGAAPTGVGPKTPFTSGETRIFDLKANGSGVPAGATAAMVTLLLVNATTGAGNMTIWANGATRPLANTLVWGGSAGRFAATAVTAVDTAARVQVNASARTDLVIDVVGYYR